MVDTGQLSLAELEAYRTTFILRVFTSGTVLHDQTYSPTVTMKTLHVCVWCIPFYQRCVPEMCLSSRKQLTFGDATTGFPAKRRLRNKCRNFLLMTCHYLDLGSASDWLWRVRNLIQPIRKIRAKAQEKSQVTFIWEIWWPLQETGRFVPNLGNLTTHHCMPNWFCMSVNESRNSSQVYSE